MELSWHQAASWWSKLKRRLRWERFIQWRNQFGKCKKKLFPALSCCFMECFPFIFYVFRNRYISFVRLLFNNFISTTWLRQARKFAAFCDCRMVSVVGGRDAEQQALGGFPRFPRQHGDGSKKKARQRPTVFWVFIFLNLPIVGVFRYRL